MGYRELEYYDVDDNLQRDKKDYPEYKLPKNIGKPTGKERRNKQMKGIMKGLKEGRKKK